MTRLTSKNEKSEMRLIRVSLRRLLLSSRPRYFAGFWIAVAFGQSGNPYHGPRWMGLWDNPKIYGMLMGAGARPQSDCERELRMKNEECRIRASAVRIRSSELF